MLCNPFDLGPTGLLAWGLVAHAIADHALQNDWMATNKVKRGGWPRRQQPPLAPDASPTEVLVHNVHALTEETEAVKFSWWNRHPAAYVHAGIHLIALAFVFGLASLPLAVAHLLIDTRVPVAWWSRLLRQTQPRGARAVEPYAADPDHRPYTMEFDNLTMAVRWQDEQGREVDVAGVIVSEEAKLRRELEALKRDMCEWTTPVFDVGQLVRWSLDQTFHLATIAAAAILVTMLA